MLVTAVATCSLGLGLASATGTAIASGAPNPGGLPILAGSPHAGLPTIALNWSGYAASSNTGKAFTYVHAEFTEPTLTCSGKPNQWTSNWVGLDGFTDQTVEQDGTFAWCGGKDNMRQFYYAWYEMYPAGAVIVFAVHPGNLIDASVRYVSSHFVLSVSDLSTGMSASKSATCSSTTCVRDSAEWIIERPALCNNSFTKCFLTALANFGTTTMQSAVAKTAGSPAQELAGFAGLSQIFMVQNTKDGGFYTLDAPCAVDALTQSFPVKFLHHGTTVPIQLGTNK